MTLLLAGDIGGTKTILQLVQTDEQEPQNKSALKAIHEAKYASREYAGLEPIIKEFLAEAAQKASQPLHPNKACFGIAGPVVNGTCKLTNLSWSTVDARLIRQGLQIEKVALINDFVAVGYGVLGMESADLHTLQAGQPDLQAPIAVIGAGTGLGEGFLINQGGIYNVYGTEGGHTDYAPRNKLEFELSCYLLDKYGTDRISVERVVSGMGIVAIYQFLRDRKFAVESPDVAEAVRSAEHELGGGTKSIDPAAAISIAAIEKRDPLSEQTMKMFTEAYGAEAGNLALKLLPNGGVYIAGGIAAKNIELLERYCFLDAFLSKGRMRRLMEKIPVHVVLNPQVGLIGSAICAARL